MTGNPGSMNYSESVATPMNIKLKINGHGASTDNVGSSVEDAILAKIKEQLTQKLAGVRCPDHGQSPKLEFEGDSIKNLKIQIRACCGWAREEAQRVLNQK
jgi:hypothetical protein